MSAIELDAEPINGDDYVECAVCNFGYSSLDPERVAAHLQWHDSPVFGCPLPEHSLDNVIGRIGGSDVLEVCVTQPKGYRRRFVDISYRTLRDTPAFTTPWDGGDDQQSMMGERT